MKIGLLTYHVSTNIGAMMQTYATCRAFQQLGHEVEIVDIRQPEPQNTGMKKLVTDIVFFKQKYEHKCFRNNYYPHLTKRYYSVEELRRNPPHVDCLVVGSDQIWNPILSKDTAMAYFLDFGEETITRFSYASSFGMERWNQSDKMTKAVSDALHKFKNLSVRERTAVKICKETFGLEAQLVVDPTLLFEDYSEITGTIPQRNEILCYKLIRNKDFFNNVCTLKENMGLPIRLLNNAYPVRGLKYTYPPSIEEWIQRIGGASFVVTDSFHGVAFSVLYKRQFMVTRNHNGRDSRFEDLLCELGLENRIFDSIEEMSLTDVWKEQIDYSKVTPKLEKLRESSWNFLKNALN